MTVTTSRGKTFPVDWMWGPVGLFGELMLQLHDDRDLSAIAADFEHVGSFRRESAAEGDMTFEGYTAMRSILRPFPEADPAAVQITLTNRAKE